MHKIINSDIYAGLNTIDDNSIDVVITSPPYWGQRNYGFDFQIGNEKTYIEFISKLVFIFQTLKHKLNENGVFFLNIGDKYLNKYGKTPLGLIPYKLAKHMKDSGWILNDIIIWYKPNHMPSSVKNRFVNSYEPVFVFSKNKENYFNDYIFKNLEYSNIIDINLQPTPFKHVAVYPEKLVHKLLNIISINKDYTVLDPFAGSGTTLKVINDRNIDMLNKYKANGIMIEFNDEYVDIIKKRLKDAKIEVIKKKYENYKFNILNDEPNLNYKTQSDFKKNDELTICKDKESFYSLLNFIESQDFVNRYQKDKLLFIGLKDFSIDDIYNISFLKNWVIRNKLVVRGKKWYPIFMLVHKNNIIKNRFNYKVFQIRHKYNDKPVFHNRNFKGYKVFDNISKEKKEGVIIEILSKYENGMPRYVKVFWKNNSISKELVININKNMNDNLIFERNNGYTVVKELKEYIPFSKIIGIEYSDSYKFINNNGNGNNYNGKFKEIERKNWGASPGARSSVDEEYFSLQRLYDVEQNIISDYLNYLRIQKGYTKNQLTELFPSNYKHTVGHWLRKDFGGSIPVIEDWEKLEKIFNIDKNIKHYACKTALRLQTVAKTEYKIPDDVIDEELVEKLYLLNN